MSQSVLSELDWDEGLTIPVANASNKVLEEEVQLKQRQVVALQNELSSNEDRVHAILEHLKNIRQELQHTQSIINARKNELETENHMLKLGECEEGRLQQEIKRLQKDHDNLKERRNMHENTIFKQTQKLEEMKSQMNWDQQGLEAWLEESAQKDEDSMTLQKYTRFDEAKVKELSLQIEHLTANVAKKRKLLDHETTETLTAQIELDKTAEEFRRAHAEREELITQWEHTIEQMQRRDKEMDLLAVQLARVKDEVRQREETIKEKQQFLDSVIENNGDQEKKISLAERAAAKMRQDHQDAEAQMNQFRSELDALKRTCDRTAVDLESTRSEVSHLKKDVVDKQMRLENAKQLHEALIEKLKIATESTLSAEERAAQMDELMMEEEKRQQEIDQELKRLRTMLFAKKEDLYQAKTNERNIEAEIQGSRAAIRNLSSRINRLDSDSLKQQEIVYSQDFTIQQLERRINRMQGEQSNEEKQQLEEKIEALNAELDEKTNTHNLLRLQIKRLQDDVRRVKRELEKWTHERSVLTNKIEEIDLHNDSSNRQLKQSIANKQEMMVDENLLKLDIKRLRDQLNNKADDVYSLENRRLQLETAMKERRQEIKIHKEMLAAQLKATDVEKSQISSELHERISKIDKLRKRYESLMVFMSPPEGDEDHSQAYYVIKAAQEKEELQRTGDELDAKIRKAEKEIRALENTLRLMNSRNETYRTSFNKVNDSSEDMEEKEQLEEQLRAVMDKHKYKRRQIRELTEDLQTMSNTLDTLARDDDAYGEMIEDKQNKGMHLTREVEEQHNKLDRASKQNAKYSRELRAAQKCKGGTREERDFEVRELREMNKMAMKQIGDVVQQHPDLRQAVVLYFNQASLPLPPSPGEGGSAASSRFSSCPSSARSSGSSVRSSASASAAPKTVNIGVDFGEPSVSGSRASSRSSGGSGQSRGGRK